MTETNCSICKLHSGVKSDITHLQDENKVQWDKMETIETKVDTIVSRLTYAAISFAIMALALTLNLITGLLK